MTQTPAIPIIQPPETFGGWIAYARTQAGYTQLQVADYCNVTRGLVAQWENDRDGKKLPNAAQLGAIVRLLDAPWLFTVVYDLPRPEKMKPRGKASIPKSRGVTERYIPVAA